MINAGMVGPNQAAIVCCFSSELPLSLGDRFAKGHMHKIGDVRRSCRFVRCPPGTYSCSRSFVLKTTGNPNDMIGYE